MPTPQPLIRNRAGGDLTAFICGNLALKSMRDIQRPSRLEGTSLVTVRNDKDARARFSATVGRPKQMNGLRQNPANCPLHSFTRAVPPTRHRHVAAGPEVRRCCNPARSVTGGQINNCPNDGKPPGCARRRKSDGGMWERIEREVVEGLWPYRGEPTNWTARA